MDLWRMELQIYDRHGMESSELDEYQYEYLVTIEGDLFSHQKEVHDVIHQEVPFYSYYHYHR